MVIFLGAFYDFQCVPNDRAEGGYQYISLNLTFPCDGAVTKWKIGTENQEKEQVYLQIWRPTGTGYMRVAETVYSNSSGGNISEVATNMTVSARDVIGFFIPRSGEKGLGQGLRVAWVPVPDHTLLRGMLRSTEGESPVATFSGSPTTLSSSPLVSVIFGKCTRISCGMPCIVLSSVYIYIYICSCVFNVNEFPILSVSVCKLVCIL